MIFACMKTWPPIFNIRKQWENGRTYKEPRNKANGKNVILIYVRISCWLCDYVFTDYANKRLQQQSEEKLHSATSDVERKILCADFSFLYHFKATNSSVAVLFRTQAHQNNGTNEKKNTWKQQYTIKWNGCFFFNSRIVSILLLLLVGTNGLIWARKILLLCKYSVMQIEVTTMTEREREQEKKVHIRMLYISSSKEQQKIALNVSSIGALCSV